MKVEFKGFKGGNITRELVNGEALGPALTNLGIDTVGVAVLVNGVRIDERDMPRFTLRENDVVTATVKGIGGK